MEMIKMPREYKVLTLEELNEELRKQLEARTSQRWISFKKQIPDELIDVLIFDDSEMFVGNVSNGDAYFDGCRIPIEKCMDNSYWMPLPEPPTGDD